MRSFFFFHHRVLSNGSFSGTLTLRDLRSPSPSKSLIRRQKAKDYQDRRHRHVEDKRKAGFLDWIYNTDKG